MLGFGSAARASDTSIPFTNEPQSRHVTAPASDLVALAAQYESGESVRQDYGRALALYCQAARSGDPRAFFALGWMFLNGRGVARDDATAAVWLRKAAKGGIPQANNLLALLPQQPLDPTHGCAMDKTPVQFVTPPPAIRGLIDETALQVGISPNLLSSVMAVESGFNPRAVSPKSAVGLMQLMPETASHYNVQDSFNERENVQAGASYLRDLLRNFGGDLTLALAAYDAGEAAVRSYGGVPPYRETANYIAAVKRLCACGE